MWVPGASKTMPLLAAMILLPGCERLTEHSVGVVDGRLTECPAWPRCVSSASVDPDRRVAAYAIAGNADHAWAEAREAVAQMPRTRIVTRAEGYLHAEVLSPWHVYTDDLELLLRREERQIAVRSSARIGYYDFEVNRDRVEALRAELVERGAVKPIE